MPKHISIIMDGNGRWAKNKGLDREKGHEQGAKTCMDIIHKAIDLNVEVLSLYAFSTENWVRPADEVKSIFSLLNYYLEGEILAFLKRGVRFKLIGDKSKLSSKTRLLVKNAERLSSNNKGLKLQLAVNYGGRDEILRAIKKLSQQNYDFENISSEVLLQNLDATENVDLLIRTSGEQRLSNFMIWQCAYAEYFFSDKNWPDFTIEDFESAIFSYQNRERRYGDTSALKVVNRDV